MLLTNFSYFAIVFQMHGLKGDWRMLLNIAFRDNTSFDIFSDFTFNFVFEFNILDGIKQ